jgi:hypothetical protein
MPKEAHLNSVQQTERALARVVEGVLPFRECLKPIHQGAIKAIGGRSNKQKKDPSIEANETFVILPGSGGVEEMVVATIACRCNNSTSAHGLTKVRRRRKAGSGGTVPETGPEDRLELEGPYEDCSSMRYADVCIWLSTCCRERDCGVVTSSATRSLAGVFLNLEWFR